MTKLTICLFIIAIFLTACGIRPSQERFQLADGPTPVLPAAAATEPPTPTSTRVMDNPWTATPIPTKTPIPDEVLGLVADVLDGETLYVVLQGDSVGEGYTVRLLGIDTPPNSTTNPWGVVAVERLKAWLNGKAIRLVVDNTIVENERVLPRYLYLGDEMINLRMLELGLAEADVQTPDTTFKAEFEAAANEARSNRVGLWGPDPTFTPAIAPTITITTTTITAPAVTPTLTPTVTPITVITPTATISATVSP